jgi:hypothetical protein
MRLALLFALTCYITALSTIPISDLYVPSNNAKLSFLTTQNAKLFSAITQDPKQSVNKFISTDGHDANLFQTPFDIDAESRPLSGQFKPLYDRAVLYSFTSQYQQDLYISNTTNGLSQFDCLSKIFKGQNTWISGVYMTENNYTLTLLQTHKYPYFYLYQTSIETGVCFEVGNITTSANLPIYITPFKNTFLIRQVGINMNTLLYYPAEKRLVRLLSTTSSYEAFVVNDYVYYVSADSVSVLNIEQGRIQTMLYNKGTIQHIFSRTPSSKSNPYAFAVTTSDGLYLCPNKADCSQVNEYSASMTIGALTDKEFYYIQNNNGIATLFRVANADNVYFAANLDHTVEKAIYEHVQLEYLAGYNRLLIVQMDRVNATAPVSKVTLVAHDIGNFTTWVVDTLCENDCVDGLGYLYVLQNGQVVVKKKSDNGYKLYRIQWVDPVPNYTPIIIGGSVMGALALILVIGAIIIQMWVKKRDHAAQGFEQVN